MLVSGGKVFLGAKKNVQGSEMRWVRSSFNLFEKQGEAFLPGTERSCVVERAGHH